MASRELSRLSNDNWALAGSSIIEWRTRGAISRRVILSEIETTNRTVVSSLGSGGPGDHEEEEDDDADDTTAEVNSTTGPSAPPRAIFEVNKLRELLCRTAKCGACSGPVIVEFYYDIPTFEP